MSVTDKLRETTEKLKDKLKGHKAHDAVRTEAQHETSESKRIAENLKGEAQYETSEGKRIAKDIRAKVEGKPGEVKEPFTKH